MDFEVVTQPEAQEELDEALGYLKEHSLWSAGKLLTEYDLHVAKILQNPDGHHFIYAPYRCLKLKSFSYRIHYRTRQNSIYIIALAHTKRHPDYWKARIQDDQD